MAQVVECLCSKCKVLSSKPSIFKKGGGGEREQLGDEYGAEPLNCAQ
jgi:hypothetical protein